MNSKQILKYLEFSVVSLSVCRGLDMKPEALVFVCRSSTYVCACCRSCNTIRSSFDSVSSVRTSSKTVPYLNKQ